MVKTKYLIICVNYHSDEATEKFVNTALELEQSEELKIIVVDNSENREKKYLLSKSQDNRVEIILPPNNLGYFGGANYGLDIFLRKNSLPEWVIVSNVDIILNNSNILHKLNDDIFATKNVGVVAPSINVKPNNYDQNPYIKVRLSAMKVFWYKLLFKFYFVYSFYEKLYILKGMYKKQITKILNNNQKKHNSLNNNIEKIYAPHGSFIIFNNKYFLNGGDLKYESFLFWEEIFVAEKTKKIGLDIIYYPRIVVSHEEHISTGKIKSKQMFSYLRDSVNFCAENFFQ
jgi:GT2 family glycosyltransferase